MSDEDFKADLQRYLRTARESVLWKLEGLGEYDVRRPLLPTGTNLLGLVKHLATVEFGYFGDTFGRPSPDAPDFDEADPNADWVADAHESREDIIGLYRKAWAHSDATIADLPLDAPGHVPWWPADRGGVTLHRVLIHVIAETDQHRGHADVVRELIDGRAGLTSVNANLGVPGAEQDAFRARIEAAARQAAGLAPPN